MHAIACIWQVLALATTGLRPCSYRAAVAGFAAAS